MLRLPRLPSSGQGRHRPAGRSRRPACGRAHRLGRGGATTPRTLAAAQSWATNCAPTASVASTVCWALAAASALEATVALPPPSLGGYGAVAMNTALTASMTKLPGQLRKTLTWDRGKELSGRAQFAFDTGTMVFFADPHSPWQRPTNENTVSLVLAC